jgi:predicted helicase
MTGPGAAVDFSALMTSSVPNFHFMDTGKGYPLNFFKEVPESSDETLFGVDVDDTKIDGISDWAYKLFRDKYKTNISKEEIFFYVYGVLSAPDFIKRYRIELKKDSPRIPLLKEFQEYAKYGRKLSDLHLNYENLSNDFIKLDIIENVKDVKKLYRIEKMRFGKNGNKSVIHFNQYITISNIPEELYSYFINGKTPIEWVMDRYVVKEDTDSGNLNDPNDYSEDPKYIFNLLLSVISMTKKVLELQKNLPALAIPESN